MPFALLRRLIERLFYGDFDAKIRSIEEHATFARRLDWVENILGWISGRIYLVMPSESLPLSRGFAPKARLEYLMEWIEKYDPRLKLILRDTWLEIKFLDLFVSAGMARQDSFLAAISRRIELKFLPQIPDHRDAAEIFPRFFRKKSETLILNTLPFETLAKVTHFFGANESNPGILWSSIELSAQQAILILSSEVRSIGLSDEIRERTATWTPATSPCVRLSRSCDRWLEAPSMEHRAVISADVQETKKLIKLCFKHMEKYGVDVSIVYRLERMIASLERLESLIDLLSFRNPKTCARVLSELAAHALDDRKVFALIRQNTHLLSRKIIERSSESGEHYITRTRKEYFAMLGGACGGGFVTIGTVVLKYLTLSKHLALFIEFLATGTNYSVCFLFMQALGFKLATKQPSMTAAALASKLSAHIDHEAFSTEVAQIMRSQFVAAAGNIAAVVPGALLFDWFYMRASGHPFFDSIAAAHAIKSLDPYRSSTFQFAALTGVLLWLSSVCAGWMDNWAVLKKIQEATTKNRRLKKWIGQAGARRIGAILGTQFGAASGNISLGAMLAFIPMFGKLIGASLDVRHVTLSAGALTLAYSSLGVDQAAMQGGRYAVFGVLMIGVLNFGISFLLALWIAAKAKNVEFALIAKLLFAVAGRFIRKPYHFLFYTTESRHSP